MQRSRLLTIFLIVFIDLLGFGLILPLLPFYAETYGATPLIVGLLTASYAAAQLIGAPLLGRLSDRYGRRPVLLVSIFGTAVGFVLLGLADPLGRALAGSAGPAAQNTMIVGLLFLSRVVDGLTGGNLTVAQAYITDVTDPANRARGLGLIGAAFGLGFIIGPAAGGLLSAWGYGVPAFAAAGLAALNLLAVTVWLPESLTPEARARRAQLARPALSAQALWQALNRPRVGPLLHVRFFFGLAFAVFQSLFALYAQYRLGLDAQATGFVLAYVGVLTAVVQGGLVGVITRRFQDQQIILAGVALMAGALLAWALTPNLVVLLVVMIPLALAGGSLNTVLSSALTKAVYTEEVGGTLGLAASVESLTRVLAPTLGGWLLGQFGPAAPGLFSAAVMAWVVAFVWRRIVVNPDPPLPARPAPAGYSAAAAD
ncbi:MAG: MFS transporter [Anaerolineales bacterium]|nr:MFS transporter [Anaerolineales bacterium]